MQISRPTLAAALALGALALACDADDEDTLGPNVAARVSVLAGDDQATTVGDTLRDSVAVRVSNARGNPVTGATVTWTVTGGGGAVSPASSTTDAQGVARTRWTLGGAATGTNTLAGAVDGVGSRAEFSATANALTFSASLTGAQVRPSPVTTPATGTAFFTWDGAQLNYQIRVAGSLSSAPVGAHVHGPQPDSTLVAGVVLDLGLQSPTPDVVSTGTATATSGQTPVSTIGIDSVIALMRVRAAYVDVHTSANPGGEIRGRVKSP